LNTDVEKPSTNDVRNDIQLVKDWIRKIIHRVTKLKRYKDEESLVTLGVDSVALVSLATAMEIDLRKHDASAKIAKALIFEHDSVDKLANFFQRNFSSEVLASVLNQFSVTQTTLQSSTDKPHPNRDAAEHQSSSVSMQQSPRTNQKSDSADDQVAIVGMAGEFPGASSTDAFWDILKEGQTGIGLVPSDRWDWKESYDPDLSANGKSYLRHGGFIKDAKMFDPLFFNIAPIDAERLDPQERRLLHTTYHALEDAGFFYERESDVGVFIAGMFSHYQDLFADSNLFDASLAAMSNRISHFFDFNGPSLTLDTMCSGSLTALHMAVQSIRSGDCKMALVGAANIMPYSGKYRMLSEQKFLSPTGRCHAFGAEADGYVPGEGVAAIVVMPVSDALRMNKRILGVVKASAINSTGRSSGFTVPSSRAQASVISKALEKSGLKASDISYFEAHGTGTSLGDPIEIAGITAALEGAKPGSISIGSVKSNIGHLEPASGLAGIIKVLLQFENDAIAPTLSCEIENPLIDFVSSPVSLVTELLPWKPEQRPRYAAVSSFGAGGSNANVILGDVNSARDELDSVIRPRQELQESVPIPLSARSDMELRSRILELSKHIEVSSNIDLYSLAFTLCCAREHFQHRRCFVVESLASLQIKLRNEVDGKVTEGEEQCPAQALAADYEEGQNVVWEELFPQPAFAKAPHYPFNSKEYWRTSWAHQMREKENSEDHDHKNLLAKQSASLPTNSQQNMDDAQDILTLKPHWALAQVEKVVSDCLTIVIVCETAKAIALAVSDAPLATFVVRSNSMLSELRSDGSTGDSEEITASLNRICSKHANLPLRIVNLLPFTIDSNSSLDTAHAMFDLAKCLSTLETDVSYAHVCARVTSDRTQSIAFATAGIFRTLVLENLINTCALIEADVGLANNAIEFAVAELENPDLGYRHVLFSNGDRKELRFTPQQNSSTSTETCLRLRASGTYVLSGGMGKLGFSVAESLLRANNVNVVLLGRSPFDDKKRVGIEHLNTCVGSASYLQLDVTNASDTLDAMQRIKDEHGSVDGIIHSAVVLRDKLFSEKLWEDFQSVLSVKVDGMNALVDAATAVGADFVIAFSSIASAYGNVGQSDYCTANMYLDRIGSTQPIAGKPLIASLNWPLIEEPRERETTIKDGHHLDGVGEFFETEYGLKALSSQQAAGWLHDMLTEGTLEPGQTVILKGEQEALIKNFSSSHIGQHSNMANEPSVAGDGPPSHLEEILEALKKIASRLSGIDQDEIPITVPLGGLGFNSVMFQKFSAALKLELSVTIPPTALFTYDTVEKIALHLLSKGISIDITACSRDVSSSSVEPDVRKSRDTPNKKFSPAIALPDSLKAPQETKDKFAIIGMNGRMPGGYDLDDYWQLLLSGGSAIVPVERWKNGNYHAGIIPGVTNFDAEFFRISPREAMLMDPQHRLFLQAAYNAILDGGYSPDALKKVGVFAGVQFSDYQSLLQRAGVDPHAYSATGNAHAMLANRVSYLLDFVGPSETVDTACSSALVALNRGINALASKDVDFALVGSVSLLLDHTVTEAAQSMGILSPDHRCATFDEAANGYVRGEGVGAVFIRRLDDALRDGDSIYGVVVGRSQNHGGRSHSLTAPNPEAQTQLVTSALGDGLAKEISYIETHGTGTALGDPIEIEALKAAFTMMGIVGGKQRIALGAVKTNVGHLEPAAGMASILKVLLCLKNGVLPANANFQTLNPYIELDNSPFHLALQTKRWECDGKKTAGISSFGFGGSNAHVVLQEAPSRSLPVSTDRPYLITVSARSKKSLDLALRNLRTRISDAPENSESVNLQAISFTLNVGRDHFEYRFACIVQYHSTLCENLANPSPRDFSIVTAVSGERSVFDADLSSFMTREAGLLAYKDAYLDGQTMDCASLHADESTSRINLPGYVFDENQYWFEAVETQRKAL
jgi:acyl transferase domain-containing protein/acyl carrier protein